MRQRCAWPAPAISQPDFARESKCAPAPRAPAMTNAIETSARGPCDERGAPVRRASLVARVEATEHLLRLPVVDEFWLVLFDSIASAYALRTWKFSDLFRLDLIFEREVRQKLSYLRPAVNDLCVRETLRGRLHETRKCDNIAGLVQKQLREKINGTPNDELVQPEPANGNAAGGVRAQRTDTADAAYSGRGLSGV